MRIRPVGATAALLDVPPGWAARWRRTLLDLVAAGVLPAPDEIVPGHRTVLVDGICAPTLARALEHRSLPLEAAAVPGEVVEIPVVYDGADLAEVARLWHTDVAGVVRRHAATDFEVEFCGFAPGFAYLAGLDETVPRRATPRTRVPPGSVALAGRFCGIYPTASPGGWQIIGRTGAVLFEVTNDPPALLPPGTRVRFVPVDDQPDQPYSAASRRAVDDATRDGLRGRGGGGHGVGGRLTVLRAGTLSTVQDGGRRGSAHLGVPRAGALDAPAARLANRLVGNDETDAVLETTLDGVDVRTDRPMTIAVTGAPAPVHVNGATTDWGVAVDVPAGSVVQVGAAIAGIRSYLAVSGGLQVAPVLGSRSTDTLCHLGPPVLSDGQVLGVGAARQPPASVPFTVPHPVGDIMLRLRIGPDDEWFAPDGIEVLTSSTYTVSADSNRVGARLHGPPIAWRSEDEMDSAGMVVGAVQVPPDGQPVVLLADHPSTGGYPVIGVVAHADLAALAQARPGTTVRLRRIGA